jgi:hypothetical protein
MSYKGLSEQARNELHFVEAVFGAPEHRGERLAFNVKNFCITKDNPINRTGQDLWIKDGTIECLGIVSSVRNLVPHIHREGKLEFGKEHEIEDVNEPAGMARADSSHLITFELEGRMESPPAGVLSWTIKCSSVNLTIREAARRA